jgi:cyanophycin synthetase
MVASRISKSKFLTKVVLDKAGIRRFPKAEHVHGLASAAAAARRLKFPVVVKPVAGAHGFGVSVGVRNRAELVRAVAKAERINQERHYESGYVVEQLKIGGDYRFYVIDGKVWAVLQRVPASVTGDGKRSVATLIKRWNARPEVGASDDFDKPLMAISIDDDVKRYLREQGMTLASVPAAGRVAWLRKQANISLGGTSYDVTDEASPQLKRWAARAVGELNLRVGGIDIMAKNIRARSPEAADAWILEVNDAPGIDIHHYPYRGKAQPVAHGLVKSMLPAVKLPAKIVPRY